MARKNKSTATRAANHKTGQRVAAPVTQGSIMSFQGSGRARNKRLNGRELVGSVAGVNSSTLSVVSYALNPGMAEMFPRLSQEAGVWEQYRFHKLVLHWVPATSTSTPGSVIISPDYDVTDAPPTTEAAISNTESAVEGYPWAPFSCSLNIGDLFALGPRKYIRSGNVPGDLKTYDGAVVNVGVVDNGTTSTIGKLWVEYDIEFFVPQTEVSLPVSTRMSMFNLGNSQAMTNGTIAFLGAGQVIANPLNITESSGAYTLPRGTYLVHAELTATDDTAEGFEIVMQVYKNGTVQSPQNTARVEYADRANRSGRCAITGIVSSTGTDTCEIAVTLNGAAGTLAISADEARITFQPI